MIVVGLTLGWVLGFAGGMFDAGSTARTVSWVVSSAGILAAAGVLAVWLAGRDVPMAAGALVLAVGEGVIHTGGPEAIDAFAAATFAYVPALLLTALAAWPPVWARVTSAGAAVAFGAHAVDYLAGNQPGLDSTASGIGYGLLGLTMIGWTVRVVRGGDAQA